LHACSADQLGGGRVVVHRTLLNAKTQRRRVIKVLF
jgi:hypothetical protein